MIKTKRLELVKFDLKYAADLFQVWSDFEVLLDGKAIGMAGCASMDSENSTFGLYYQFGKKYWGNGYVSECANAIIRYVFEHDPQATIKADAVSINPASLSVLRKVGFEELDISENGFNRNDLKLDLVNFEMTKNN